MSTILVLDDSATMVSSLARILRRAGYTVETGANGQQGVNKIVEGLKPAAIVTDLNMPEMDGIAFIKAARKLPPTRFTPIIVLTTEASRAACNEARSAGATGWLTKPTEPDDLLATIRQFAPAE